MSEGKELKRAAKMAKKKRKIQATMTTTFGAIVYDVRNMRHPTEEDAILPHVVMVVPESLAGIGISTNDLWRVSFYAIDVTNGKLLKNRFGPPWGAEKVAVAGVAGGGGMTGKDRMKGGYVAKIM